MYDMWNSKSLHANNFDQDAQKLFVDRLILVVSFIRYNFPLTAIDKVLSITVTLKHNIRALKQDFCRNDATMADIDRPPDKMEWLYLLVFIF